MSNQMKRSTLFCTAAMVGVLAVYAPLSVAAEHHGQHTEKSADSAKATESASQAQRPEGKQGKAMNHEGMNHGAMNHEGMDHSTMMNSPGADKAEEGSDHDH